MIIIGYILTILVFGFTLQHSSYDFTSLFNIEGLTIVFGGTVAIAFSTFRPRPLWSAMKSLFKLFFAPADLKKTQKNLAATMKSLEQGHNPPETPFPLINKGVEYYQAGIVGTKLETLLMSQAEVELREYQTSSELFTNLSKYPPALGMIGTVFGIVGIFSTLNEAGAKGQLGQNLAFAMTATLYGLVAANFLLSPLAEGLEQEMDKKIEESNLVIEVFKLFSENEASILVNQKIEKHGAA